MCNDGFIAISQCPREYVGVEMSGAVNIAGMCRDGILPESGALMDQSAWFVDLWQRLLGEVDQIEAERWERRKTHG